MLERIEVGKGLHGNKVIYRRIDKVFERISIFSVTICVMFEVRF